MLRYTTTKRNTAYFDSIIVDASDQKGSLANCTYQSSKRLLDLPTKCENFYIASTMYTYIIYLHKLYQKIHQSSFLIPKPQIFFRMNIIEKLYR